ncbi:hypothetical protein [Shimia sp.]|uniref:hypothetical protein n=1 Tax=Shimia sp. TaxID=1954381 RepID=UPI00329A05ED
MKARTFIQAAVASIALGAATLAFAEDKTGTNVADNAQGTQGPVAQLAMAQSLYNYGMQQKNALAVLTAAQITLSIEVTDVEREVENKATEGAAEVEDGGDGTDAPVSADMMLASARELAGGDETVLGLIEDVEAEGARGRIGGPSRTLSRLRAGRTDVFRVPFYGNSLAELAIIGDGDADLDLLVTDENGNVICKDVSYSDQLYCSWTPRWDGYFLIGVVNQGRIRNSYYIVTN